ncbi:MAG TPA: BlaI/MecI/CopY family transcriptional regulator [Chloroflexota bacterium]|nr:BlaI/MecI/CopY family transcriptional regulator [Chloroflexota bacterium]
MRRPSYHKILRPSPKVEKYLGGLQAEIMELVWQRHPVTVRDVTTELAKTRAIAYTTVMTVMSRLAEKGLLRQQRDQKSFVYEAAVSRDDFLASVSRDIVRDLLRDFGTVAVSQFVSELSEQGDSLEALETALRAAKRGRRGVS